MSDYKRGTKLIVTRPVIYDQGPILHQPYMLQPDTEVTVDVPDRGGYIGVTATDMGIANSFVFLVPPDAVRVK